jgi:hypothetical protein
MAGFEVTLYGRIWVTPKVDAGAQIYARYGGSVFVMCLPQRGEHSPFPFVQPSVVLVGQNHFRELAGALASPMDGGFRLVVEQADEVYIWWQTFQ